MGKIQPRLTLTGAPLSAGFGAKFTFTATLSATLGGVPPTGSVTFTVDGTNVAPIALAGGKATYMTTTLIVGRHSITSSYSGDGNYDSADSNAVDVTVTRSKK